MLTQPYRPVAYRNEHRHGHTDQTLSEPRTGQMMTPSVKDAVIHFGTSQDQHNTREKLQEKMGLVGIFHMIAGREARNNMLRGRLEATGEDHFVIRHAHNGQREVISLAELDHAVFTESTSAYTNISGHAAPTRQFLPQQ
ncbi:spore coat protein GerQ [Paenibacillus campi]|uniref:spore coat protein GerQ n=1 Tax=Paenibacillus campi TaxID=3106031 RepID=UPI002AFE1B67|nr:spore coat protein GerQ [Paenibacillus sp. SGZ-1014]